MDYLNIIVLVWAYRIYNKNKDVNGDKSKYYKYILVILYAQGYLSSDFLLFGFKRR